MCQQTDLRADALSEYWLTSQGLAERWKMFSKNAVYRLYNTAMRELADAYGANLEYRCHPEETATGPCPDCEPFCGRTYTRGQFKPFIPRHPGCVCEFVPYYPASRKYIGVV